MSDASSYVQLTARIEALERHTQRLKRLLMASAATVLCLGTLAATAAQQHSMTFTGASGSVRISSEGFILSDSDGHKRLTLGFSGGRPAMYLWDARGVDRLGVYLSNVNQPVIRLTDSHNADRAFFGLTKAEKPRISFEDANKTERLYVGLSTTDDGLVSEYSTSGTQDMALGNQLLVISDGTGTDRAYMGLTTANTSVVKLWDSHHIERAFMGEYSDGVAGMAAFNSSGSATWSSP